MSFRYDSGSNQTIPVVSPSQQIAMSRFISHTYGWMFLGLMTTAVVSFVLAGSEAFMQMMVRSPGTMLVVGLAQLGVVIGLSAAMPRLSKAAATLGFLAYSALTGVTFSMIFLIYTMSSIANVFIVTSLMFGGMALYGTVTKKDLTGMGSFLMMGLWGMILVALVNMFFRSESLSLATSVVGVVIFAGLTAYDSQRVRALAYQSTVGGGQSAESEKGAIFAALMLYLNFINLFLSLLRLFGQRRE